MKKVFKKALIFLATVVVLLAVWEILYLSLKNEYLIPKPSDAFSALGGLLSDSSFWRAFGNSLLRSLLAFFISFALALLFAVPSYLVKTIRDILRPLVSFVRSLPTMAIILLILIWSTPLKAPIVVASLALFPILYSEIYAALCEIPKDLTEVGVVYKVPIFTRIRYFILPYAFSYITAGCASALSFSLKLIVSAEIMAKTYVSLGGLMQESRMFLEIPTLFALIIIVVLAGFLMESALLLISGKERRFK